MKPQPIAYSYIRFSNPAQAAGDSLRRQTEAARAWCARNGYQLDESTTLRDLGASAYLGTHRSNPDRYALAGFLKLVEAGKVPRGSALVVESLDRLSREHIRPALSLVLSLIESGVRLVQLAPVEAVLDEKVEPMSLMMAIMELSRGHSESAIKSERIGKAWRQKKEEAREGKRDYTSQTPAWVRVTDAGLELIPDRAAAVKRMFNLSAHGYGLTSIINKLIADKVPPFGKSGEWRRSYVARILRDRRAVGEFQPRTRDRKPDGEPIAGYFPAAVTEDEYHAARAGADDRRNPELKATGKRRKGPLPKKSKRQTRHETVNLFTGLIVSARDPKDKYHAVQRVDPRKDADAPRTWSLINAKSVDAGTKCVSFALLPFETAVLRLLQEIDAREILGGADGPDESLALAGELGDVETQIGALESELMTGDVPSLARVLRSLEDRRRELATRLASAKAKAATPASAAWGEASSLLEALTTAPDRDDARRRLRAALRRIVERITLLIVPRGRSRIAAVRIDFAGGRHRDYVITYSPPHKGFHGITPERLEFGSEAWTTEAGEIDLRVPTAAAAVEKYLFTIDLTALADAIAAKNKPARSKARKRK